MQKTILLVEDDAIVRDVMKSAFERDYIVLEASGCSEAAVLLKNHVDIALIDYMLQDGNGCDLLRTAREIKPELPIIIMTAYRSEDIAIKALRAGATDYVKKPVILAHLRKKVSDILEGKGSETSDNTLANREEFILDGIAAFIEENYSDDLTRDKLSEKACMNKYRLSKAFNERFGQNIKSYINNNRVKKAAELLQNHDLGIGDIAETVGFGCTEHFIRIFKDVYGVSPREYRLRRNNISKSYDNLWDPE
ncbi:MAG: response regulator transcription factor [Thermodesulfovibrionales bacterium]